LPRKREDEFAAFARDLSDLFTSAGLDPDRARESILQLIRSLRGKRDSRSRRLKRDVKSQDPHRMIDALSSLLGPEGLPYSITERLLPVSDLLIEFASRLDRNGELTDDDRRRLGVAQKATQQISITAQLIESGQHSPDKAKGLRRCPACAGLVPRAKSRRTYCSDSCREAAKKRRRRAQRATRQ
jgi:predicted nucleic acid-binding Zn ribbon protein